MSEAEQEPTKNKQVPLWLIGGIALVGLFSAPFIGAIGNLTGIFVGWLFSIIFVFSAWKHLKGKWWLKIILVVVVIALIVLSSNLVNSAQ